MKTFLCIEHGTKFIIEAPTRKQAEKEAAIYGGEVIKEITKPETKKPENDGTNKL